MKKITLFAALLLGISVLAFKPTKLSGQFRYDKLEKAGGFINRMIY